jgi:hypothetical protein
MISFAPPANHNSWRLLATSFISEYGFIALQFCTLLIAFKVSSKIEWLWAWSLDRPYSLFRPQLLSRCSFQNEYS